MFPHSVQERDSSSIVLHKEMGNSMLLHAEVQENGLKIQPLLS